MNVQRLLLTAVLLAGVAACGRDPRIPSDAQDLSLAPSADWRSSFYYTGYRYPAREVIRDQQAWDSAWSTIHWGSSSVAAPPAVDFATEMVVLAAMGEHPTGGYSIQISEAALGVDAIYVLVTEKSPGQRCGLTQALTQPVALARLPRFDGEVKFLESQQTTNCW